LLCHTLQLELPTFAHSSTYFDCILHLMYSCILYECTLIVILNEHATFVVVCSFELSKGNSVAQRGPTADTAGAAHPTARGHLGLSKSTRVREIQSGCLLRCAGGADGNTAGAAQPAAGGQCVKDLQGGCRADAVSRCGAAISQGRNIPHHSVLTVLSDSRTYICARHRLSACCSRPEEPAQCGVHPGPCILAPASWLLHLRAGARSALHLQGLCVPGVLLTGGARTSEECDDSSVAVRAAIAAAWTSTGQRAAIAGSAFVNALPGQEGISPAPSSIESPVCSVYICTALQGGHLCVRRVKVDYTMPEVLDLPDPRSILKPSSVVPLCRRVHRHGVRRQSQRHAVGVSQLPGPEPAHVRPAGRLRQCRLHRGRRGRAGAAQCPSLREYRVFVSGCHDSHSWQGHLTGTPACRCHLVQLHSPASACSARTAVMCAQSVSVS